jgi:hypothetical protein
MTGPDGASLKTFNQRGAEQNRMSWERDWPLLPLLAVAALLIAPLWCVTIPAMPDYPAHFASFWLIGQGGHEASVSGFYRIQWAFLPNLAAEIAVPLLARLVSLESAIRIFLSAALAFWVLGPAAINRALHGRIGAGPFAAAFFAYNVNFMWGFFNFYFAAGLAFLIFAAWIATAERKGLWRIVIFTLAVTLVYFCHIFAVAVLGIMIGGFELARLLEQRPVTAKAVVRRGAQIAILFVPSALAFLFLKPGSGADDHALEFNLLDTMLDRYESLIQHYYDKPDYVLPALLLALLLLALYLRRARLPPVMNWVLGAMAATSLLAPEWAMGGWACHLRMPAIFAATLFAACDFRLGKKLFIGVIIAALGLSAWNAKVLAAAWRGYDSQYREFRGALGNVPRGAKLLTVLDGDAIGLASDQPYWHMAEFAISARGAFTPLMFTTKGQHVVRLLPPYTGFAAATAQQGSPPDISELDDLAAGNVDGDPDIADIFPYLMYFQCHFDQVVLIHLHGPRSPVPAMLHLRHAGSFFSLYDVRGKCPG